MGREDGVNVWEGRGNGGEMGRKADVSDHAGAEKRGKGRPENLVCSMITF